MASHAWSDDLTNEDINIDFNLLHDRLISSLDRFAPEKKITLTRRQSKCEPWIIPSLIKSFTKQRKYYKEALKHKENPYYWEKYKSYKAVLDKAKEIPKNDFLSKQMLRVQI